MSNMKNKVEAFFEDLPIKDERLIRRHSNIDRLTHWAIAIFYIVLWISGLALFHPYFYWLSAFFGGGPFMRIIHPFVGVLMTALFFWYAAKVREENKITEDDKEWLRNSFAYMNKDFSHTHDTGKYNGGQKMMFWSVVVCLAVLLITGILIWQPYFAPYIPAVIRRMAVILHALSGFIMFIGIGVHIYASIWTKGSLTAMTRGTVSKKWAKTHHPAWFRKMTGR